MRRAKAYSEFSTNGFILLGIAEIVGQHKSSHFQPSQGILYARMVSWVEVIGQARLRQVLALTMFRGYPVASTENLFLLL